MNKLIILIIGVLFCSCAPKVEKAYIFSYFTGNGHDGLHWAYSYDGFNWQPLNNGKAIVEPVVGPDSLMRDPSVVQGPDGIFYMVWTTGWWDNGIGFASSADLVHWSNQRFLPVMANYPSTRNTWAPELFYNDADSLYYIVWASTVPDLFGEIATSPNEKGLNHRLYFTTTSDFESFSPTQLFFEPGFSVIDGAFIRKDGLTWMFLKNEMSEPVEKNIRVTSTANIADGFNGKISANITGDAWAEGPSPLVVGDSVIVFYDKYREHKYGAIISADCQYWLDAGDRINLPAGIRHGTAFSVEKSLVDSLITAMPAK